LQNITLQGLLQTDDPALDAILEQQFTGSQIANLKGISNDDRFNEVLDRLLSTVENPFGDTPEGLNEFRDVLSTGIARTGSTSGLPADVSNTDFNAIFGNPNLGTNILSDEANIRRDDLAGQLSSTFTGAAFDPLDDTIIDEIVSERTQGAQQQIGNVQARQGLSAAGSRGANEFLQEGTERARDRVEQEANTVRSGTQRDINDLRDIGLATIGDYQLGDPLPSFTGPNELFAKRQDLIDTGSRTLGRNIRAGLPEGSLFDITGALQAGSRVQGPVSGPTALLDTIAQRERNIGRGSDRRGVGSKGSGAF